MRAVGRNASWPNMAFDGQLWIKNELALEILQSIVAEKDLEMPVTYDINAAALTQNYDFPSYRQWSHVFRC